MFSKVEKTGARLKPRFYPTLTMCGGKAVLIGGWEAVSGDGELLCGSTRHIQMFHIGKGVWEEVVTKGETPPALVHHTAVALNEKEILVMGGSEDSGTTRTGTASLFILNLEKLEWVRRKSKQLVTPKSTAVLPMASHTAVLSEDGYIFVFGGNAGYKALQDLWRYSIKDNMWEVMPAVDGVRPPPRQYHASCWTKGRVYIFGGAPDNKTTRATDIVFSDLWYYDTTDHRWVPVENVTGRAPSPRGSCTATFIKPYLYLYGGFDGKQDLQTFHRFDVDLNFWEELPTPGWVVPRWGAAAAPLPPPHSGFLMYGGYSFNSSKMYNETLVVTHEVPSLRYLVSKFIHSKGIKYRERERVIKKIR